MFSIWDKVAETKTVPLMSKAGMSSSQWLGAWIMALH
jgi:hypothetical protein